MAEQKELFPVCMKCKRPAQMTLLGKIILCLRCAEEVFKQKQSV